METVTPSLSCKCRRCGGKVTWLRKGDADPIWLPEAHTAPCGLPCLRKRPTFQHAHTGKGCPKCKGKKPAIRTEQGR